jgi:serine/threonine protein kinase
MTPFMMTSMTPSATSYKLISGAMLTCVSTGEIISLTQQIAESGEGEVWQTNRPGDLAKIYHNPRPEQIRKLEVMVANPPTDPNAHINHISFAWPKSLLQTAHGNCVGFLMPAIANSVELLEVYSPRRRQKVLPGFNWLYLHTTALNIASIVRAIHAKGYVLGDIKPQNILVNNQALPAIIDTDSFQVRDSQTGEIYRCPVGSEGFTPMELLGKDLTLIEQTDVHDRFRLAIVIHLLLFGDHPFKGKWMGEGDSPDPTELLRQGFWPYAPHSLIQSGPLTISLDIVHPEIQKCFLRCFNSGHTDPNLRPTAQEWYNALKIGISELSVCQKAKRHYYSRTYGKCYWCERKQTIGIDIFSSHSALKPQIVQDNPNSLIALKNSILNYIGNQIPDPILHQISSTLEKTLEKAGIKNLPLPNLSPSSPPIRTARKTSSPTQPTTHPIYQQISQQTGQQIGLQMRRQISQTWENWQTKLPPTDWQDYFKNVPQNYRPLLTGLGAVIGGVGGVFALLVLLSRSKMSSDNIELTITGIVLCLGLVGGCFLLAKATDKLNL